MLTNAEVKVACKYLLSGDYHNARQILAKVKESRDLTKAQYRMLAKCHEIAQSKVVR